VALARALEFATSARDLEAIVRIVHELEGAEAREGTTGHRTTVTLYGGNIKSRG
jgi:hypothetical protein